MDSQLFGFEQATDPVLVYFEEHSEEIENVVIPLRNMAARSSEDPSVGMIAHLVDGDQINFTIEDAEILLNDGILSRMGIPTNLMRPR
ncbi:hypothetical protein Pan216_16290 [Planctomycetes bacterium Pan216]|uniref:Uncharacterized protein n=1 Tax=Kolteria novifilia TaxID=2527975 RepID=A0A518B1D2_9BACT|nr:hypothetical protein Pan216_16290 [Planctomycetes bacterium Pan216]